MIETESEFKLPDEARARWKIHKKAQSSKFLSLFRAQAKMSRQKFIVATNVNIG